MRKARRIGHAVMVVLYRVDAGTVAVACLDQAVEGPQIAGTNRKTRCAITQDRCTAQVFKQLLGADDVLTEGLLAQIAGTLVAVAMAGQFMPLGHDGAHQIRIALGDPAQREKCGLDLVLAEQIKNALHIVLDAAFALVPLAACDIGSERRDLEIVFNVDRQGVGDRIAAGRGREAGHKTHCGFFSSDGACMAFTSLCSSASVCILMRSMRIRLRSSRCRRSSC